MILKDGQGNEGTVVFQLAADGGLYAQKFDIDGMTDHEDDGQGADVGEVGAGEVLDAEVVRWMGEEELKVKLEYMETPHLLKPCHPRKDEQLLKCMLSHLEL
jgi:hypothetical protein